MQPDLLGALSHTPALLVPQVACGPRPGGHHPHRPDGVAAALAVCSVSEENALDAMSGLESASSHSGDDGRGSPHDRGRRLSGTPSLRLAFRMCRPSLSLSTSIAILLTIHLNRSLLTFGLR